MTMKKILANLVLVLCFSLLAILCLPSTVSADTPGAFIHGYVLDEDGNRVPFANITLWQGGQLWQNTKFIYSGS